MRIVVTGGAGFLGSYVVDQLRSNNEVFVPRSAKVDLTNFNSTFGYLSSIRPNIIFHLAAKVGGIEANRRQPGTFFYSNMQMGMNILEYVRLSKYRTEKVIITGTICSYPKFAPIPFKEDDLWKDFPDETNAAYGVAKKALLVMAQAYRKEFNINTVMLLPVNLYGPRDHFDPITSHVIPGMIRKFLEAKERGDKEVILWGDGTPTREFLYVQDAAEGIVACAEKYSGPDPVNLGSGEEISINNLAYVIKRHIGYKGSIVWDTTKPNGQPRRKLDTSRALERFNWQATTKFEIGLKNTINWYLANRE